MQKVRDGLAQNQVLMAIEAVSIIGLKENALTHAHFKIVFSLQLAKRFD